MIDKSIILNWKIKAGSIRSGHETQLCHMMKLGETILDPDHETVRDMLKMKLMLVIWL